MPDSAPTEIAFDQIIAACKKVFQQKNEDYGPSWTALRPSSLTDQIYIKARRIRSIEEKQAQKVADSTDQEFVGIINYSIMALMQLSDDFPYKNIWQDREDAAPAPLLEWHDKVARQVRELLLAKNHDYGEAWRDMRPSSFTDLILTKLLRIRQIENNHGASIASEGADANYRDIINYAVFALVQSGFAASLAANPEKKEQK